MEGCQGLEQNGDMPLSRNIVSAAIKFPEQGCPPSTGTEGFALNVRVSIWPTKLWLNALGLDYAMSWQPWTLCHRADKTAMIISAQEIYWMIRHDQDAP
jgi:hypothetical protein